jgi:predicted O-linked N-acetylglucosamine transferase (SPINDLY family)
MKSVELSQEIELLNHQLSDLDSIEQASVKTAAEAIVQAEIVAQAEAKKSVLNTALSQLQNQLKQALQLESLERHSENLKRCEAFELEAAQRLKEAAQKFAEAQKILQDYHQWEKKHFQLFIDTYEAPQSPSRLRLGNNDWNSLIIPTSFDLYQESQFSVTVSPLNIFTK